MSKLEKAEQLARQRDAARHGQALVVESENGKAVLATIGGEMTKKFDARALAERVASGKRSCAPQIWSIPEGDSLCGILEGNGPEQELAKPGTGEVHAVQTWILRGVESGLRVSILSSVQLDRKLPPLVGRYVEISRGPERKTNSGGRYTEYIVEYDCDGLSPVDWASKPKLALTAGGVEVIDVPVASTEATAS